MAAVPGSLEATAALTSAATVIEDGEPSEEAEALAEARATGEPVEVPEAATPTETLVANPDGTLTLDMSAEPVRTENEAGDLVDIDTSLEPQGTELVTVATTADVALDRDGDLAAEELLAEVTAPESEVTVGLGYDGALSAPVVDEATATYAQDEFTAVRVTATDAGFAAHVLLAENPIDTPSDGPTEAPSESGTPEEVEDGAGTEDAADGPVYRFPITVEGATARLVEGVLEFVDASGVVVGASSTLRMWDAQVDEFGDPSNVVPVDAALVSEAGGQVLELRPDPAFLSAADTVYPVTVDPDVNLGPQVATYVSSGSPNTSFVNDWSLRVGSSDGSSQNESFVNFETESLTGQTVTNAKLEMYQYAAGHCDPRRIEARMATSDWQTGWGPERTWNNRGSKVGVDTRYATKAWFNASAAGGSTPDCGGPAWEDINVTGQVSGWAGMAQARRGIYLTTPPEFATNTGFEKRFCSDNRNTTGSGRCQDNGLAPRLLVTYTPQVGDQGWYSTSDHPLDERTTLKVNHRSGNTYIAADDVQVTSLGMDLQLGRRYNSRTDTVGQFGQKWTLSGGPDVWLEKIDEWRYVYHAPDGAELGPFVRKANTAGEPNYREFFTPAGGIGGRLKDNNDNTFTLTFNSSQTRYEFTQIGSNGHLYQTKQTDRSGNSITYNYAAGTRQLNSVTDTAGRTYQITYGSGAAAGRITEIRDTNGPGTRTWTYAYTAEGRLSEYTDPEDDTTTYDWVTANATPAPVVATITSPANDSGMAPTATIDTSAGETVRATYAGDTSAQNPSYAFTYQLTELAQCKAKVGEEVDWSATVISSEPTMGETTYCFKDRENGNPESNSNNMSTTVIDAKNDTRSSSFSPDNQPEVLTNDSGSTVNTYGDPGAQLGDRLEKSQQPTDTGSSGGAATTFRYDTPSTKKGHEYLPSSVIDGNGDCTAYAYDDQGRLTDTWIGRDPSSGRCDNVTGGLRYRAAYNTDGTVAWMSDPNSNSSGASPTESQKTLYTYWQVGDPGFVPGTRGQVKTMRRPGGDCATGTTRRLCTSYTYDGLARTTSQIDGRGTTTRYSYDPMDRTTQVLSNGATNCDTSAGTCITYTYDTAGNLIERFDSLGTTEFDFDRLNRQTRQATPDGVEVTYGYNRDGRLASLTQAVPGVPSDTVTYGYDNAGLLMTVTDAAGTINVTHDASQRLQRTTFPTAPQATVLERSYTKSGQIKAIDVRSGTTTNDQMTDYHYFWTNENNQDTNQLQRLEVKNSPASITYTARFDYNNRGQLLSENRTNGGGLSSTFTYDNAGNIATIATGGTTTRFGYDYANQLCWTGPSAGTSPVATCPTTAPGTNKRIARDAAGNSEGDPADPIGYNARNQANSIDGQAQDYHDQGNDLRVDTGYSQLVNTQPGITARTTGTGAGAETTFFTRMPDGRLLTTRGPGGTFYYVTDQNKTVLNLVNASGQRAGTYRYDPYGQATLVENTPAEQANPFRWISGYQHNADQPGGYIKLGARYYNPATGAFTQTDPEPGNMNEPLRLNAYAYGGGDPINNTDPTGRYWGEDAVESVTDWDGWDEVAEFGSMMAGCWSGMNLAVEASSSAAFAATAVAGPEAGLGVTIGSGVVGCLGGMYLAYEGADAAMDVPVGS